MPAPEASAAPSATRSAPQHGPGATREILLHGALVPDGRLVDSSNNALVGAVTLHDETLRCVYKPTRGERPLWDFPDGTLAGREVAAALVARAAGWECTPETVFRDGPFGAGMVQEWVDDADPDRVADLIPADDRPPSWLPVLAARDESGRALVVAHADDPALAVLAAFDLAVNNADRKASHILATPDGRIRGVDHGLTFHVQPKLRTILWGWAGRPLPAPAVAGLAKLKRSLDADLAEQLAAYLSAEELAALRIRIRALIDDPVFPLPPTDRTAIPWPPL